MAVLKLVRGEYRNEDAMKNLLTYVLNATKMPHNCYGGRGVSLENPLQSMNAVKNAYGQCTGKQAEHFILAFDRYENPNLTLPKIYNLAYDICEFFRDVQVLFALHEVKNSYLTDDYEDDALHLHFILNTVNLRTGQKFRINFNNEYDLIHYISCVLEYYGISHNVQLAVDKKET